MQAAASPIRALCDATGLTLPQIADELGVSIATARSMSCGRLPASDRVLRKIAFLFRVDLRRLFEDGTAIFRDTGERLTPELWQEHRRKLDNFAATLAANLAAAPDYRSPLHTELSAALLRAADRGDFLTRYAEIHALLRAD